MVLVLVQPVSCHVIPHVHMFMMCLHSRQQAVGYFLYKPDKLDSGIIGMDHRHKVDLQLTVSCLTQGVGVADID